MVLKDIEWALQRSVGELLARYSDEHMATVLDFLTRASEVLRAESERLGGRDD